MHDLYSVTTAHSLSGDGDSRNQEAPFGPGSLWNCGGGCEWMVYKPEKEEEAGPGSLWNCGGSCGWRVWKPGREDDVGGSGLGGRESEVT